MILLCLKMNSNMDSCLDFISGTQVSTARPAFLVIFGQIHVMKENHNLHKLNCLIKRASIFIGI